MNKKLQKYENDAVNLLRNSEEGILSTVSKLHNGYPFGSFVTFITDRARNIFFYISDLAQHTKNINHNSKACITLSRTTTKKDKQNSERLTLIGDIEEVENELIDYCRQRFFKHFPQSKAYEKFHDFKFYKMSINQVRWIGGFGKIAWLETKNWTKQNVDWLKRENNIIQHMNDDHKKNICSALNYQHQVKDVTAKMIFLTVDGYYVESNSQIYFIKFSYPVYTSKEYKDILVSQAKEYRSFEII